MSWRERRIESPYPEDYNDAVREYNSAIKRLPGNLLADMFGFEAKDYFEADEKAAEVPTVSFQ